MRPVPLKPVVCVAMRSLPAAAGGALVAGAAGPGQIFATVPIVCQSVKHNISVDMLQCAGVGFAGNAKKEKSTMSQSPMFEKGLQVRKEVLGEDYVNKSIAGADEFTRTMAEWSTEFCWGA